MNVTHQVVSMGQRFVVVGDLSFVDQTGIRWFYRAGELSGTWHKKYNKNWSWSVPESIVVIPFSLLDSTTVENSAALLPTVFCFCIQRDVKNIKSLKLKPSVVW